jgi:DNA invertase Pin-like site-specific DNA recombinase
MKVEPFALVTNGAPAAGELTVLRDTTTSHGRLILTVLGGLAEFERDLID